MVGHAYDLTGATDGYCNLWESIEPVVPDFSVIGGKARKDDDA